jgi:hypothetical protein
MAGETRYVGWSAGDSTYVCDGVDDHVQINQALAWATSNPGNTVYLRGPYTYDIALSLEIGSDTELTGDSTACLRLHDGLTWAAQVPVIKQSVSSIKNIIIHGFEIDCNRWNIAGDEGDGLYNGIGLSGYSSTVFTTNIQIYDMNIHDSLGDGIRIKYASDVQIYDNVIDTMGHEGVYFIEVVTANVHHNNIVQKDNSAIRTDNSQDIRIYNNITNRYVVTDKPTVANGNGCIQIGNQPAEFGRTRLTQNIYIYNNQINDGAGSGVLLMDAYGQAGSLPQTVNIYNNILSGCGWMRNIKYNGGVSVWNWGNGLVVEKNTITGSYNAGIVIQEAIASGCTMKVANNNVINSRVTLATDPARKLPVSGYGFLNMVPSKMSVVAENNYCNNNVTGNYYQVVPVSEATAYISDALPGGDPTNDDIDEVINPDTGINIPAIRRLQSDELDYYEVGRTGYIDGVKFQWKEKKVDVGVSNGQDKCPGTIGWALTHLGLEGAELTLDCMAQSLEELFNAIAAFTKPGRINIELGGDFSSWRASGISADYSTDLKLKTIIPRKYHPYSLLLAMDLPFYRSNIEHFRSRYISSSGQFSADNCYLGNLVDNSSFENWSINQSLTWESAVNPADVEYRCIRWAKELRQFCAVAVTGTDNRIVISDGTTWRVPYGLSTTNKNNAWRGLAWCPDWGIWVACSISGLAGYHCIISADGDAWTAKATPEWADGMAWGYNLFIPPSETFAGRLVTFAYSGPNSRVMYTDDACETWYTGAGDDTYNWVSADYSPEQDMVACIAYDGPGAYMVQLSADHGASWESQTCPIQHWTSIRWISALSLWVACSEDGTQQIMTSPTGMSGTWTLRDTPISGSTITPGTGTEVSTTTYQTPDGYKYSTSNDDWTLLAMSDASSGGILSIEALTNGHKWKIDRVFCDLRTVAAGGTAWIKITATTATIAETTLAEWSSVSTTFEPKTKDITFEAANDEAVTLKVYMKSSSTSIKAVTTDFGYELTEFDGTGGSTITYTRNQQREIAYAPELGLIVVVAQTGTGNGVMYSTNAVDWIIGTSAADNAWVSACYAADLNMFAAVSTTGTGNRIMTSNTYGAITGAPDNWVSESAGATRSANIAIDGLYSLEITGDGTTAERGITTQKLVLESGSRYVLSGYGKVTGRTAGSLVLDILVGNAVIKELTWSVDGDFLAKQISFRPTTTNEETYVRVYGKDLNSGAVVNIDKVLVEKATDFELAATGSDIATTGAVDVVPDVIIKGVTHNPDTAAPGEAITFTSPEGTIHTTLTTLYARRLVVTLPTRTDGGAYRLDKVFTQLRTITAGKTAYMKITVTAASKNSGNEYQIAEFSTQSATYVSKSRDVAIQFDANESVTISYYIKTSNSSVKAAATEMGHASTIMNVGGGGVTTTSGVYLWNAADTSRVMAAVDTIYPKYTMEINEDGTGSFGYNEDFLDDGFLDIATSKTAVTYNSINKSMVIAAGGSIVFPFPCKFPVVGIPDLTLFVKAGNPQISIAADNAGSPGTFYAVDGNQTEAGENSEMYRILDNEDNLRLNTRTKYYVKIAPYTGESCEISSMAEYASLSTVDVERFFIYKGGQANTIGVQVEGRSSIIVTLRYRDWVPAV